MHFFSVNNLKVHKSAQMKTVKVHSRNINYAYKYTFWFCKVQISFMSAQFEIKMQTFCNSVHVFCRILGPVRLGDYGPGQGLPCATGIKQPLSQRGFIASDGCTRIAQQGESELARPNQER